MVVDPAWVEAKNHKNLTVPFSLSQRRVRATFNNSRYAR